MVITFWIKQLLPNIWNVFLSFDLKQLFQRKLHVSGENICSVAFLNVLLITYWLHIVIKLIQVLYIMWFIVAFFMFVLNLSPYVSDKSSDKFVIFRVFLKKRRRPVSNDFTVHTRRSNVYTCTCCFRCFRVTLLDVEAFHTSNLTVRCIDMWCGNLRVRTQEGQAMGRWQERLGTM